MIDLNMKPKKAEPEGLQPEEIICAVIALAIWIIWAIGIGASL